MNAALDVITFVVAGAVAVLVSGALGYLQQRRRYLARERGFDNQIESLIDSLNEANDVIQGIELEIRARQQLAEKLQADAEQSERLLELNREQLDAVGRLVGTELRRESRRSFWLGAAINLGFFVAGVVATLLAS